MLKSSMKWVLTMLAAAVVVALAMAGSHWQTGKADDTLPTVPGETIPFTSGDFAVLVNQPEAPITLEFPAITLNNLWVEWKFTPAGSAMVSANGAPGATSGFVKPDIGTLGDNITATFTLPAEALQNQGTIKLTCINNYDASDESQWSPFGDWTVDIVTTIDYYIPLIGTLSLH